jgi:hypothetical protein
MWYTSLIWWNMCALNSNCWLITYNRLLNFKSASMYCTSCTVSSPHSVKLLFNLIIIIHYVKVIAKGREGTRGLKFALHYSSDCDKLLDLIYAAHRAWSWGGTNGDRLSGSPSNTDTVETAPPNHHTKKTEKVHEDNLHRRSMVDRPPAVVCEDEWRCRGRSASWPSHLDRCTSWFLRE